MLLPRVVVVHRDVGLPAALTVLLEGQCAIDAVGTAADGLHRLSPPLSAVLFDCCPPDLDGASFLRALRARLPACPAVAIAARGDGERLRELTTLGIDGLVWKPVQVVDLLERIQGILGVETRARLRTRPSASVAQAIQYLARHYAEPLTVALVARAAGISATYLAHRFPLETGMTIKECMARIRIAAVKPLLRQDGQSLERIAALAGFYDASHFSRVFRRYAGRPPGDYRRLSSEPPPRHVLFARETDLAKAGCGLPHAWVVVPSRRPR